MKNLWIAPRACLALLFLIISGSLLQAQQDPKVVHVFVPLCDNYFQGIVPVPKSLGNGQHPPGNLYWGATFGLKTYLSRQNGWEFLGTQDCPDPAVLERVLFRHRETGAWLVADAYDGAEMQKAIHDFLQASAGGQSGWLVHGEDSIGTGGKADLLAFTGHNGLMDFQPDAANLLSAQDERIRPVIILACYSKDYFSEYLKMAGAKALVWTTGLMAPEAYTLEAAVNGWLRGESNADIRRRAAVAYDKYQKCGVKGASRLLVGE